MLDMWMCHEDLLKRVCGLLCRVAAVGVVMCASSADAAGWSVSDLNGAPGLFRDGKPVAPILFWQWELEEQDVRNLSKAGVDLYSCFGSFPHYANPYWTEQGFAGLAYQEKHLDSLLKWNPDAAILPRLFCAAPKWWISAHSEEQARYGNPAARVAPWEPFPCRESFASVRCREELTPVYRAAVRRLYERYGRHLLGIHVANGPWGEHFSWDALVGVHAKRIEDAGFGDVSAPMAAAFRVYLKAKYGDVARLRDAWKDASVTFETATVPTMTERLALNADGWRNPAEGRKVPDFFGSLNSVTADLIDHYAGVVKEATDGRVPTLAFYGYTQDESWTIECDHRAIARAYRSPRIDMFSAPHTYHRRRPGEDASMRCYLASAARHGKLFIDEGDDLTHLEWLKPKHDGRAYATNLFQSVNLLYREFGQAVTHGTGLWYMDLTKGNFRDPELVAAVARMRRAANLALTCDRRHLSEVAVISNVESEFYMGYRRTPANGVSERLYREQMDAFCRAGAPYDWYLAEDLDAVVARPEYKVVALLDCEYLTDGQYEQLMELRRRGTKLLFFHAPGYVSQTGLSWDRVRRLTGGRTYGKLALKSAAELRADYRAAGVHLYTETDDAVLSANAAWVMLHVRKDGDYVIRLPRQAACVTDVTTGRVVGTSTDCVTLPLKSCQTSVLNCR